MAELFDCGGPEVCWDDLCRGADEGICGIPHPHTVGEPCSSRDCWECVDEYGPDTAEDSDECPGEATMAEHGIPQYAMLDVWMALGGDPLTFDIWRDADSPRSLLRWHTDHVIRESLARQVEDLVPDLSDDPHTAGYAAACLDVLLLIDPDRSTR